MKKKLICIAVFNVKDAETWQTAAQILDNAGLNPVCEGGLGHISVNVRADIAQQAKALLENDSRLKGKRISPEIK